MKKQAYQYVSHFTLFMELLIVFVAVFLLNLIPNLSVLNPYPTVPKLVLTFSVIAAYFILVRQLLLRLHVTLPRATAVTFWQTCWVVPLVIAFALVIQRVVYDK